MADRDPFRDIAEIAIMRSRNFGADMAEAYISSNKELSIDVREGRVETLKLAEERGLSVRVMFEGKTGFAFSTDLSPAGAEEVARHALFNCKSTAVDPYNRLPSPGGPYPGLEIYDPDIHKATVEEKIAMAKAMEESARAFDPRVKVIESSTYQDGEILVTLVNSLGIDSTYRGAYCGIYLALAAGEGEESQTGFAMDFGLKYKPLNPAMTGQEAARRAVRMLGAGPVKTRRTDIVLEPYVATGFLGIIGPALTGEAVQKGRSLFAGKTGARVASEKINIIDDGAKADGIASAPFDGEGVATGRTVLVRDGVLQGYLHNTYTAAREGVQSTGNGVRGTFKSAPEVGFTNMYIEAGDKHPQEIIEEMESGIYITEVMGMHTANPISGDFSVGVAGLLIEKGELSRPVRGAAMGGNILDFLKKIDGVGNDLLFYGGKGSPTLRITGMTVSGQ